MRRVIKETITLIRIERWLIADEQASASEHEHTSEQILEQIVLHGAEVALVRELVQRLRSQQLTAPSSSTLLLPPDDTSAGTP